MIKIPATNIAKRLVLFHGSGDSAEGFANWIQHVSPTFFNMCHKNNIEVLIPDAPMQKYTPNGGWPQKVWFDRDAIAIDVPENLKSVNDMCERMFTELQSNDCQGVPLMLGGFSQGACMCYHLALRVLPEKGVPVAKMFALSGFLKREVKFKISLVLLLLAVVFSSLSSPTDNSAVYTQRSFG